MKTGTKSVLFGAHCFFLHPWFVAAAWTKLYGFPWDPRLWVAFFVHDLGYIGKAAMDDEDGETHPQFGARIMYRLFDSCGPMGFMAWLCGNNRHWWVYRSPKSALDSGESICEKCGSTEANVDRPCISTRWHDFCLLHSRYYAKRLGKPFSRLCVADKLSFALTPRWLYLPMVNWTGEIHEYLNRAKTADTAASRFKAADYRGRQVEWHIELCRYMRAWVDEHKDGAQDTWTSADRHARSNSGVWQ